jgi:hypothetical protein
MNGTREYMRKNIAKFSFLRTSFSSLVEVITYNRVSREWKYITNPKKKSPNNVTSIILDSVLIITCVSVGNLLFLDVLKLKE